MVFSVCEARHRDEGGGCESPRRGLHGGLFPQHPVEREEEKGGEPPLADEPLVVITASFRSGGILGRKVISILCGNGACHPPDGG